MCSTTAITNSPISSTTTTTAVFDMTKSATTTMINKSATHQEEEVTRIAVFTFYLNAGETTRAVEIASSLRALAEQETNNANNEENADPNQNMSTAAKKLEIRFFSTFHCKDDPKVSFEHFITNAGFDLVRVGAGMSGDVWRTLLDREHAGMEYYTPSELDIAKKAIQDTIVTLQEYQPAVVLHGFFDGAIPSKILNIPTICYSPLPLDVKFINKHLLDDLPDNLREQFRAIQMLPKSVRRFMAQTVMTHGSFLPMFGSQPTYRKAAIDAGWKREDRGKGMLMDMTHATYVLVNDLKGNYNDVQLPSNHRITGPVFPNQSKTTNNKDEREVSQAAQKANRISPDILRVFDSNNPNKVFIAMGSSGHKAHLVEAIKGVAMAGKMYHAVVLVPPTICSLDDIRNELKVSGIILGPNILLTDLFVPAKEVNRLADVAIIHGGQGTVQTAMNASTPIIGIGFQPEQVFNLECIATKRGAGVRLDSRSWKAENIASSLQQILSNDSYRQAAKQVKDEMDQSNGSLESARQIWNIIQHKEFLY